MISKKVLSGISNSTKSRTLSAPRAALLIAIEPRMLFDGAAMASVDSDPVLRSFADVHASDTQMFGNGVLPASLDSNAWPAAVQQPLELVVIDSNVKDWQMLAAGLGPNTQLLVLDARSDGLMQIAQTLSRGGQYSAVHLISHGQSEGRVVLGNRILNNHSLSQYSSELIQIGDHLTADGDLLLYGCNVADGSAGANFLQALAQATRADVAASIDNTGGTTAGGDWVLEATIGDIQARLPIDAKTLSATFSNSGTNAGYGPYIDLFVPARGADGGASPDGVTITGASYLGSPLVQTTLTLSAADITAGRVEHPYFTASTGAHRVSIPAGFQAGDQLVVFQFRRTRPLLDRTLRAPIELMLIWRPAKRSVTLTCRQCFPVACSTCRLPEHRLPSAGLVWAPRRAAVGPMSTAFC